MICKYFGGVVMAKRIEGTIVDLIPRDDDALDKCGNRDAMLVDYKDGVATYTIGTIDDRSDDMFEHRNADVFSVEFPAESLQEAKHMEKDLMKAIETDSEIRGFIKSAFEENRKYGANEVTWYKNMACARLGEELLDFQEERKSEALKIEKGMKKKDQEKFAILKNSEISLYRGERRTPIEIFHEPNSTIFSVCKFDNEEKKMKEMFAIKVDKTLSKEEGIAIGKDLLEIVENNEKINRLAKRFRRANYNVSDLVYSFREPDKAKDELLDVLCSTMKGKYLARGLEKKKEKEMEKSSSRDKDKKIGKEIKELVEMTNMFGRV